MEVYKRILVPLDGSKLSESVLPEVEKLASVSNIEICLIRVVYSPIILLQSDPLKHQADVVREAEQYLENLKNQLEAKGFTVDSWVWYEPNAAEAILKHIEFFGTDLIVMATHGRSGLQHLLMGSIAEKVVHSATKPVMLVRPNPETLDTVGESRAYATLTKHGDR